MAVTQSIGLFVGVSSAHNGADAHAPLSAPGTYYKTFTGLDFRALDSDDVVRWAFGTGGGVRVKGHPGPAYPYQELGVDLPSGAQVTEVTFYFRNFATAINSPKLYFGAYMPSASSFTNFIPEFDAPSTGDCLQTQSSIQAITPTLTVDNSQARYVIGYKPIVLYGTDTYDMFVRSLLVGARVTYQVPGAFLPLIQR